VEYPLLRGHPSQRTGGLPIGSPRGSNLRFGGLDCTLWLDGYEFWPHGSISEYCVGGPAWRGDPLAPDARDKTIDGEIAKAARRAWPLA